MGIGITVRGDHVAPPSRDRDQNRSLAARAPRSGSHHEPPSGAMGVCVPNSTSSPSAPAADGPGQRPAGRILRPQPPLARPRPAAIDGRRHVQRVVGRAGPGPPHEGRDEAAVRQHRHPRRGGQRVARDEPRLERSGGQAARARRTGAATTDQPSPTASPVAADRSAASTMATAARPSAARHDRLAVVPDRLGQVLHLRREARQPVGVQVVAQEVERDLPGHLRPAVARAQPHRAVVVAVDHALGADEQARVGRAAGPARAARRSSGSGP